MKTFLTVVFLISFSFFAVALKSFNGVKTASGDTTEAGASCLHNCAPSAKSRNLANDVQKHNAFLLNLVQEPKADSKRPKKGKGTN